jgi:hypothetical protein
LPRSWRFSSEQASSTEIGCSGIRITSAPPAVRCHRDPAGVAAHHLDHHHAVVRLGGRVQPVDRLGTDRDRSVEAEGVVRRREVVVDRLRDADHGQLVLGVETAATPRVSSPPITTSASSPASAKLRRTSSTPPSTLYGFVRDVPITVPPRGSSPETSRMVSAVVSASTSPRQPFRTPTTSYPRPNDRRATARMTAFSPGQSPPPVRIPTRFIVNAV